MTPKEREVLVNAAITARDLTNRLHNLARQPGAAAVRAEILAESECAEALMETLLKVAQGKG